MSSLRHPTEDEMMEMIEEMKQELIKASDGEFGERDEAFFKAGFRCGISSFLRREALRQLFFEGGKTH